MKKIIILGSEGFIGNHLVRYFSNKGYVVFGCDLFESTLGQYQYFKVSRLSPEWDEIFLKNQFECCINAAGSGNVSYSMNHPLTDFEANTLDTIRTLDVIRRMNPSCRYLHISSAAVYGNPTLLPIPEDAAKHPLSPYGWHKLMSEQICAEYHQVYGVSTAIIRPFSVYGEGLRKQLLWDMCQRLRKNDSIQLFGTGKESRDFIHCSDLVRLMDLIVEKGRFEGEVYNAASGVETCILEIAEIFCDYFNGTKKISFSGEVRPGDPLNWRADIRSLEPLRYSPFINLADGVKNYIHWFEKTQVENTP